MPPTSNSHLGTTTLLPVAPLIAAAALLSSRRNPTSSISTWPALAAAPLVGLSAILFTAGVLARRRTEAMRVKPQPAKDAGNSSVHYSYKISPSECDEHGRLFGGELLKLIDVSAGLVAAKHAGSPCLTISVDRVIFLSEIRVGDVISISSAVNRAWGSSMEIGVKVGKQSRTNPLAVEVYCCHAYLTFVAKHIPPPPPSTFLSLSDYLGLTSPPPPRRFKLAEIKPSSLLEQKRFLLAGRRRAHRIQRSKAHDALLATFREEIFAIERERERAEAEGERQDQEELLLALQLEILADAWIKKDPDVHVDGEDLVGEIEGYVDPVRVKLVEVEKAAKRKGHGGWHRIAVPTEENVDRAAGHSSLQSSRRRTIDGTSPLGFSDSLVKCLWIVRPQMYNSKGILFGGQLMRWVEEAATIAVRRIHPTASWSSAGIDGLTFLTSVQPGEVCYARAAVLRVFDSSVEVACVVTCEDRNSPNPVIRLVSQSFFTMVAIDSVSGRPLKSSLRQVRLSPDSAAARLAAAAEQRREERLLDKQVLQRMYA